MTKVIDIGALASPERAPRIRVGEHEVPVLGLSGDLALRFSLAQREKDAAATMEVMLAAIAEVIPDLPEDARKRLTFDQITAIVKLSQGGIEAVEAEIAERAKGN
ncbi:MAG: hypothetical protein KIS74_03075 [Burkholderiales bacterium]|nr:hypothetical protein [Burkholderiales bacterium]